MISFMTLLSFIKKRPHLIWHISHPEKLSASAIVETVLNNGDWKDVQSLLKILTPQKTARIFYKKFRPSKIGRSNYRPEIAHYFNLYFSKHA